MTLDGITAQNRVEYFCNEVASEFLVPSSEIANLSRASLATAEQVLQTAQTISNRWHVSQAMVVVKLSLGRLISPSVSAEVAAVLSARWTALRNSQREKSREAESGPNYYVVKRSRLGAALIGIVEQAVRSEALTHTKAAKVLGVGVGGVEMLFRSTKKAVG